MSLAMASKHQSPYTSVSVSRKRQRHPCTNSRDRTTTVRSPLPSIPFDILIDIFKRSDKATVVRCAATAKPIRRAILDPDFLRELCALRADAHCGFDPALLVGVTFTFSWENCSDTYRAAPPIVSRSSSLRFDAGLLRTLEPVASRGGLVVLRRRFDRSQPLRVSNSLTGRTLRLPLAKVRDEYPPALLDVDDAGRSFQLLVAHQDLRTQIFSSEHGEWGAVVEAHVDPPRFSLSLRHYACHPVVLGRSAVYWLCSYHSIIALDVGAAQATVIGVPPNCFSRMSETQQERADDGLLLVASADGKLGLLVAEYLLICMWTMTGATEEGTGSTSTARWTRQVMIQRHAIDRQGPGWPVRFLGFGERSGTVILQMHEVGLVEINLGSKETRVISREFRNIGAFNHLQMCLHETDLSTVIHSMKHI